MKRIAFFIPTLSGGGAERVVVNLLKGMVEHNIHLDLILTHLEGEYLDQVPVDVKIVNLDVGRVLPAILPLSKYLRQNRPDALISHLNHANVIAVLAKALSRTKTKLILVEHNTLSSEKSKLLRGRFVPFFVKWFYPQADAIVGVSQGVSLDLRKHIGSRHKRLITIYNPVVDKELFSKAKEPLDHPWFREGEPPVILAVGRLTEQKDFSTLIKAFHQLTQKQQARLLILGDGESRSQLEALIHQLGIAEQVLLPGFVENPYAYMSRASVFVLSSRWEGLPTVLIEAMACGCPVVATNCPSGPSEILENGKHGCLVPIGNTTAMADAMLKILEVSNHKVSLIERGSYFSVNRVVSEYLELLD